MKLKFKENRKVILKLFEHFPFNAMEPYITILKVHSTYYTIKDSNGVTVEWNSNYVDHWYRDSILEILKEL